MGEGRPDAKKPVRPAELCACCTMEMVKKTHLEVALAGVHDEVLPRAATPPRHEKKRTRKKVVKRSETATGPRVTTYRLSPASKKGSSVLMNRSCALG